MREGLSEQASNPVRDVALREQLLSRRRRLESAIPGRQEVEPLVRLLQEVDAALERMTAGTFGVCETCNDAIENDRLLVDPLCRNCLDHLSTVEQQALERDLDLAFQVQNGLLPSPSLTINGWEVAHHYDPAGPVSGDYCDLIVRGDGSTLFALGDVSGKGVAAAMLMTQLHGIFRGLVTTDVSLPGLMAKANRLFCEGTLSSYFATLVCGWLRSDGEVEFSNAGHSFPLHVRAGGVSDIETGDLPLGLFCDSEYGSRRLRLAEGDSLLLYTDGLSEALDPSGLPYGVPRISSLLDERRDLPPKAMLKALLEDLVGFRSGAPKVDDLAVMAIRRAP